MTIQDYYQLALLYTPLKRHLAEGESLHCPGCGRNMPRHQFFHDGLQVQLCRWCMRYGRKLLWSKRQHWPQRYKIHPLPAGVNPDVHMKNLSHFL